MDNSYVCPRCGYSHNLRFEIKRHFDRKTCCRNTHNVDLTEEIIEYVLEHKVWHQPKKVKNGNDRLVVIQDKNRQPLQKKPLVAIRDREERQVGFIDEQKQVEDNSIELATISNVEPMTKTTACGKKVWALYACNNGKRLPIRVVVENGQRKLHLFDFIQAMTGCVNENTGNEWKRLQNGLENDINTKILMSKKYRFPMINAQKLTKADSLVIDIFQASKVASAIGPRAKWFTDILLSLGNRFMAGDLDLIEDVEYMHIAQRLMADNDPDNFLRLWGEEFMNKTQRARREQQTTNAEQIIGSTAETVQSVMENAGVTRDNLRKRRSMPRTRDSDPTPGCIGKVYVYPITPHYNTRQQVFSEGFRLSLENNDSVIASRDDLGSMIMVKTGNTQFSSEERQLNYTRSIDELYDHHFEERIEVPIDFLAKLTEVENKVKAELYTPEKVGLIRDDGKVYYPNEVFLVDSMESAKECLFRGVEKAQMGVPINSNSVEIETVKLNQMRETTKQIEMQQQAMQMQMQMQALQMLEKTGGSKEDIIKVITALCNKQ